MRYKIVYFSNRKKNEIVNQLRKILDSQGGVESEDAEAEFIFIIGGDGSFFHFVKEYAFQDKKLVGIQAGNIAFSLNFKLGDLESLDHKQWKTLEFLEVQNGDNVYVAMNDVYVSGKLFLESDVYINGVWFEKFRGSGLLFCTKCGSTGMNKSVGGPILISDDLWLFNELGTCNTSLNRSLMVPLVLSKDHSVSVKFFRQKNFHMYVDGQKVKCSGRKNLHISMVKGKAQVLRMDVEDYINKIRDIFLV